MTDLDLDAIEARIRRWDWCSTLEADVLIAEIRRLRAIVESQKADFRPTGRWTQGRSRLARLAHKLDVAYSERDEARAEVALYVSANETSMRIADDLAGDVERLEAATARVRALCAGADDSEYTTVFAAAVLAALDARDDPSATTTIPIDVAREHAWLANHALEMLVDTGDGTYHPIADALAKVRDLLDPSATTEGAS